MTAPEPILLSPGLRFIAPHFADYEVLAWPEHDVNSFVFERCGKVRVVVSGGGRRLPHSIEALPSLGLLALVGTGYEGIEVERYLARNVVVTHSPGANALDVADHGVGLLLALEREIVVGDERMRRGAWVDAASVRRIRSMRDLRIGIVGMGAVGNAVASRLTAFGALVSWWGPRAKSLPYPQAKSLLDLASASDVLFLTLRADASNRHVINQDILSALGSSGIVVNLSRGSAIDEDAMIGMLRSGSLGGAALDVFAHEPVLDARYADIPRCVLTPHLGGAGLGAWRNQIAMVRDNLARFFDGRPLANPVPRDSG